MVFRENKEREEEDERKPWKHPIPLACGGEFEFDDGWRKKVALIMNKLYSK